MKSFSKLSGYSSFSPSKSMAPTSMSATSDLDSFKSLSLLKEKEKRWDETAKREYTWEETSNLETTSTWGSLSISRPLEVPVLQKRLSSVGAEIASPPKPKIKRKTLLGPQRPVDEGKLTVILDLDETLIHSEFTGTNDYRQAELREHVSGRRAPDFSIVLYEGSTEQDEEIVHVYKRPGVENFLKKLSEICEPVIFTAALPMYARPILKQIDPKRRCRSRLYRNATIKYRGIPHVKSLKLLGRDLSRTVLIDNSPVAMCSDPENAILAKPFYEDPDDRELDRLYELVKELVNLNDVRPYLTKHLNFQAVLHDTMASLHFA